MGLGLHVVVTVPDVVVHVEVEERPGLASRLRDDEVVEGVVLRDRSMRVYEQSTIHSQHLQ
jgi:hypothetical protein